MNFRQDPSNVQPLDFQDPTVNAQPTAATPQETTPTPPPAPAAWKRRPLLLDDELQPFALLWLQGLPDAVKPRQCAQHYPRVLNKLAALWNLDERCMDLLDELLLDRRRERQGFGYGIPRELRLLRQHRLSLSPGRDKRQTDVQAKDFPPTAPMDFEPSKP